MHIDAIRVKGNALHPKTHFAEKDRITMMLRTAVACLLLLASASANFLYEPQVQWSYTLPQADDSTARALRRGNAVVASQDDTLLFITTQDASLFILQTSDGLPIADVYQPPAVTGATTSCQSGVALAEVATGVQYAVYAVIDNPDPDSEDVSGETPQR